MDPQALFTQADSTATDFSAEFERSIFYMGRSWVEESVRVNTSIEAYVLLHRNGKIRRGKIRSCEQGLKVRENGINNKKF